MALSLHRPPRLPRRHLPLTMIRNAELKYHIVYLFDCLFIDLCYVKVNTGVQKMDIDVPHAQVKAKAESPKVDVNIHSHSPSSPGFHANVHSPNVSVQASVKIPSPPSISANVHAHGSSSIHTPGVSVNLPSSPSVGVKGKVGVAVQPPKDTNVKVGGKSDLSLNKGGFAAPVVDAGISFKSNYKPEVGGNVNIHTGIKTKSRGGNKSSSSSSSSSDDEKKKQKGGKFEGGVGLHMPKVEGLPQVKSPHTEVRVASPKVEAKVDFGSTTHAHQSPSVPRAQVINPNIQTSIPSHPHSDIHANIHTNVHANVHTNVHSNIHPNVSANVHANVSPTLPHVQANVHLPHGHAHGTKIGKSKSGSSSSSSSSDDDGKGKKGGFSISANIGGKSPSIPKANVNVDISKDIKGGKVSCSFLVTRSEV